MALTFQDYTANGTAVSFAIPFDRIRDVHVKVFYASTEVTTGWSVVGNNVIFSSPPPNGTIVRVRRITDFSERLVDYVDGSRLNEVDLDTDSKQAFYLIQENRDINDVSMVKNSAGNWEADFDRIQSVANPVENNDAVNKLYVDQTANNFANYGVGAPATRWAFTGNGTAVVFSITGATLTTSTYYLVTVNGSVTDPATYNVTPNTLTFNSAPANASAIVVVLLGYPKIASENSIGTSSLQNGAVTTAKLADANVTIPKLANPQYTGFRNRIINGNFDIWQRGTSFNTQAYGADRWLNWIVGSSCTMTRQNFTIGQTDVPNEPTHFCRMEVTSSAGAANAVILMQHIESVRRFAGQTMTVSFYAKAAAAKPIAVSLLQFFGTGGSPSSSVATHVTKTTLSTSWQKVTATVAVPSIAGKTIGNNGDDRLTFGIWFDAGSSGNAETNSLGQQSGTFDIAQVQVEQGSVATPFEARPIGAELALCQRYYQKCGSPRAYLGNGSGTANIFIRLPVEMRTTPTATYSVNIGSGISEGLSSTDVNFIGTASGSTPNVRLGLDNVVLTAEL